MGDIRIYCSNTKWVKHLLGFYHLILDSITKPVIVPDFHIYLRYANIICSGFACVLDICGIGNDFKIVQSPDTILIDFTLIVSAIYKFTLIQAYY